MNVNGNWSFKSRVNCFNNTNVAAGTNNVIVPVITHTIAGGIREILMVNCQFKICAFDTVTNLGLPIQYHAHIGIADANRDAIEPQFITTPNDGIYTVLCNGSNLLLIGWTISPAGVATFTVGATVYLNAVAANIWSVHMESMINYLYNL